MTSVAESTAAAAGQRSSRVDTSAVTVIRPWRPGILARFAELWRFRSLLPHLGIEFVMWRYRNTYLAWWWIPLRPALDIGSRALLFGGFLGVSSGDRPYFIFIAFASAGWILFERALFWGTRSTRMNQSIARELHLPRTPTHAAAAAPAIFDFILYALVAFVGTLYFVVFEGTNYLAPPRQILTAIAGLAILLLFGLGVSLWTSAIAGITKEVRFALGYVLQIWYFVTPVIYPISDLPENYRGIAEYNPITAPIEMVKFGFLDTSPPQTRSLVTCFVTLTVVLVGGLWSWSRFERAAVERL